MGRQATGRQRRQFSWPAVPVAMNDQAVSTQRRAAALTALVLAVTTVAVFSQVVRHDFINLDDRIYIADNPRMQQGLTAANLRWFWTASVGANWHPLTVLSHLIDCQFFGLDPGWHHAVNLAWHTANTLLLFWVLARMTGNIWPSALVAALFGWHPLHVESVAWVSERKDVLSTWFWFLTLAAYWHYTRRSSVGRYLLVAASLGLGLMAKPMLVTVPLVLLLLDFWPLGRLSLGEGIRHAARRAAYLVAEKVPLFLLVAVASAITVVYQKDAGAMTHIRLAVRLQNAAIAYTEYVGQAVWPTGLSVFYPHPGEDVETARAIGALIALVVATVAALCQWRKRPYVAVGWLWFVGTLVPVIGIVQVGDQARADRYTYVPLVGLFLIVAWGARDLVLANRRLEKPLIAAAGAWLVVLGILTWQQVGRWRNTETLFSHALAVSNEENRNWMAYHCLGDVLSDRGAYSEAIDYYRISLARRPENAKGHFQLGFALLSNGNAEAAIPCFLRALSVGGDSEMMIAAYNNLARGYVQTGQLDLARTSYEAALRVQPHQVDVRLGLVNVAQRQGRGAEAVALLHEGVSLTPDEPRLLERLARIHATSPARELRDPERAVALAERACRLTDFGDPALLDTLSLAYASAGRFDSALDVATQALQYVRNYQDQELSEAYEDLEGDIVRHIARYQARQAIYEEPTVSHN